VDEVARLRDALSPIEAGAKQQDWDAQRPWRTATHVGWAQGVPIVDLHDLKVKLAKQVVRTAVDLGERGALSSGAVIFVTGRGRHSLRHDAPVKQAVHGMLAHRCGERAGWSLRQPSAGRVVWVYDRDRAPRSVLGGGGGWLWLWFLILAVAAVVGLVGKSC